MNKKMRQLWEENTSWFDKKGVLHIRRKTESGYCETVIPQEEKINVKLNRKVL